MPNIFPPSANPIAKASIILALSAAAAAGLTIYLLDRSPYHTGQGQFTAQEVPFSHDHHTEGLGIDCRYCHTTVEESAFAGIPPTQTCMNCHKIIWNETEMLKPVRDSFDTGQPLVWRRVNDLPDYVYFNHSIHVAKGIGCESCHGPVNEMPLVYQEHTLQMGWCLDCHRDPGEHIRPRDQVVNMNYEPERPQSEIAEELLAEYDVAPQEHCWTCHR